MDPLKILTEHHIHIQNKHKNTSINLTQAGILVSAHMMDALCFGAGSLTPEEEKKQKKLTEKYLETLKPGNDVLLGLNYTKTGAMEGGQLGIIISNDGQTLKVQAGFLNSKRKQGIRSFSTKNGYSLGPANTRSDRDKSDGTARFFIMIPDSHRVQPTMGMPKETRDKINELYRQAEDPKTCYDLVNNLKYGNPKDNDGFIS